MAYKQTGFVTFQDQLRNPVEMPAGLERLWGWFLELCHTDRIYVEGGVPLPLSSLAIWAWSQLRNVVLEAWELRAIRLLDGRWLAAQRKKPQEGEDGTGGHA